MLLFEAGLTIMEPCRQLVLSAEDEVKLKRSNLLSGVCLSTKLCIFVVRSTIIIPYAVIIYFY